jgi:D-alanine transaminase
MAQIAYVNGKYVHQRDGAVHIEDRGYQFSDGIYEYIAFYNRRLLDEEPHLARLQRSIKEINIEMPVALPAFKLIMRELIARNERDHGAFYIQVTRGVARRDHAFPAAAPKPALVMTISAAKIPKPTELSDGVRVITQPEQRWARRDIKSISLLANVLAKQEAAKHKAREAWLIEDGDVVTEGSSSNAYIVNAKGEVVTHPADHHILGGVTREVLMKLAKKNNITVIEKPFTLGDVNKAAEAFLTSTSGAVIPVVKVGDVTVGSGKPGEVTKKLMQLFASHILKETGYAWKF